MKKKKKILQEPLVQLPDLVQLLHSTCCKHTNLVPICCRGSRSGTRHPRILSLKVKLPFQCNICHNEHHILLYICNRWNHKVYLTQVCHHESRGFLCEKNTTFSCSSSLSWFQELGFNYWISSSEDQSHPFFSVQTLSHLVDKSYFQNWSSCFSIGTPSASIFKADPFFPWRWFVAFSRWCRVVCLGESLWFT